MRLRPDVLRRLTRARERLRETPEVPLSIEALAREVAISPFHFIRQFEAAFGLTPHQYRMQSRLDHAKYLLATGQWSVTDVCMEVGFSSLGSFSDLFTRRVGTTPSGYRRRLVALTQPPARVSTILTPGCFSLLPLAFARSFQEAAASSDHYDSACSS